jgi:ABC-2 type transport system permease protein
MAEGIAGTGTLLRLAVRRDRVMVPLWVAMFVVMAAVSADATVGLYPDTASRVRAAEGINGTPSLVALYGRIYDVTSLGAIAMIKMGGIGSALLAVVAFTLVIRHTRAEEETGRLELLAGGVLGGSASLVASLAVAITASAATGVLTAGALVLAGLPASGSLAFGLAWTATGVAFAGVGAVAAQVTASARAARGLATAVLGLAYMLRALGDSRGLPWLSWSSPLGWGQQVRPFAGDRWSVSLVLLAFAVVCVGVAQMLSRRRDLAAGLVQDRPGRAEASAHLRSSLGLAWRLERGVLLAWAAGFAVLGLVLGNVAANVGDMLGSPQAREMIRDLGGVSGLTDAFMAAELGFMAVIGTAFGIQAVLRMYAEETSLRLEGLLATGASRPAWFLGCASAALLGPLLLALVSGLAVGAANAAQTGDPGEVGRVLAGALAQLPAVWVVVGLALALYGLVPRVAPAAWAFLVLFLLLGELGPLLQLPGWALDLSPYGHVPRLPGGDFRWVPLAWLGLLAVTLAGAGLAAFRRRDLVGR